MDVYASHDQMDASDEEKAKYQALDQDIQTTVLYAAGCDAKLAALGERLHVPVHEKSLEGGTWRLRRGIGSPVGPGGAGGVFSKGPSPPPRSYMKPQIPILSKEEKEGAIQVYRKKRQNGTE